MPPCTQGNARLDAAWNGADLPRGGGRNRHGGRNGNDGQLPGGASSSSSTTTSFWGATPPSRHTGAAAATRDDVQPTEEEVTASDASEVSDAAATAVEAGVSIPTPQLNGALTRLFQSVHNQ